MDFPLADLMDEDACYAKLLAVLHPSGLACPRCGAVCVEANLWEELLLLALRHEVEVACPEPDSTLALGGGVAAVLSEEGRKRAARAAAERTPVASETAG